MPSLRLRERFRRAGNSDDTDRDGAAQSGVADGMLASAPVPLDWKRFADRRPRRLKRGKHFVGEPKLLHREARDAAESAGMVAVVEKDQQGKWGYVWVQFVDAEVNEDEPCPVCDARELLKLNNSVMRCPSCDSMLAFIPRPLEMPPPRGTENSDAPPQRRDRAEIAEIVSTRVLRADGSAAEAPSTADALTVETTVRSYRPGLRLISTIAVHIKDRRIFVSRQPEWVELTRPGLYRARAHIPAGFLANHPYRVKVAVSVDDGSGGDHLLLVRRTGTRIAPHADPHENAMDEGLIRPALEWTTEVLDAEDADTGLVSAKGSAGT